jgi:catechol 2,3-dioxygenase-like lactoylglutathione lyase family enzyme
MGGMASRRLDHVGLNVRDLDKAAEWYTNTFDLRVDEHATIPEAEFRFLMLRAEGGFRIELLERTGSTPGLRANDPLEAVLTEGYGHMALEVDDVDAFFQHLLRCGATPILSPRAAPVPGARMAYLADPEGNLIEILHRDPPPGRGGSDKS